MSPHSWQCVSATGPMVNSVSTRNQPKRNGTCYLRYLSAVRYRCQVLALTSQFSSGECISGRPPEWGVLPGGSVKDAQEGVAAIGEPHRAAWNAGRRGTHRWPDFSRGYIWPPVGGLSCGAMWASCCGNSCAGCIYRSSGGGGG